MKEKSNNSVVTVISGPGIKELDSTTHIRIQDNISDTFLKIPIPRRS